MSVAKITEISARSEVSFEDAVRSGLKRASETLEGISGAWVESQKVDCDNGSIVAYRVVLKVTFVLND